MSTRFNGNSRDFKDFAIKINAKHNVAHESYVKATALCLNNLHSDSIKYYLQSIFANRKNPDSYLGLGVAYRYIGEYQKSIANMEKAFDLSENNPKISLELGISFLQAGFIEEAIMSFQHSLLLDRKNLNAQLQLGVAHELLEEYELALMIYQKIIDENKSYITAYNHKAALLIDLKMYKEAGAVFKSILKLNPRYFKAYLGLGIIYDKMNQKGLSLRYYRKYLELKPNSKHAPSVKEKINKLKQNFEILNDKNSLYLV